MNYKIRYQVRAVEEFENAIKWYGERSEKAADNFFISFDDRINILKADPKRFSKKYKEFRETLVKRYPFSIIYFIDENLNTVVISSIFHLKRNPKLKFRKLY